eukprot:7273284-Pyramimonas_sp.AAC.1
MTTAAVGSRAATTAAVGSRANRQSSSSPVRPLVSSPVSPLDYTVAGLTGLDTDIYGAREESTGG